MNKKKKSGKQADKSSKVNLITAIINLITALILTYQMFRE